MDEINKVHIWELPEKTTKVDKSNEYIIIHDGYSKKVTLERFYEYFNQDYKMNNLTLYLDEVMDSINREYETKYLALELLLDYHETLVKELEEKFKVNKYDIRHLLTISGMLDTNIVELDQSFKQTENKCNVLLSEFENLSSKFSEESNISDKNAENIEDLELDTSILIEDAAQLYINSGSMKDQIDTIRERVNTETDTKKEELIENIQVEYDKILEIIDHYHHMHYTNILKYSR